MLEEDMAGEQLQLAATEKQDVAFVYDGPDLDDLKRIPIPELDAARIPEQVLLVAPSFLANKIKLEPSSTLTTRGAFSRRTRTPTTTAGTNASTRSELGQDPEGLFARPAQPDVHARTHREHRAPTRVSSRDARAPGAGAVGRRRQVRLSARRHPDHRVRGLFQGAEREQGREEGGHRSRRRHFGRGHQRPDRGARFDPRPATDPSSSLRQHRVDCHLEEFQAERLLQPVAASPTTCWRSPRR